MKNIVKNVLIFVSYFIYEYVVLWLLKLFSIDIYSLEMNKRIIILTIINAIYIVALVLLYKKELKTDLKDCKKNYTTYFKKYISYYMIGAILMGVTNLILQLLTNTNMSGNQETIVNLISIHPIYMSFLSVIYAPIVEELIFRKSIRNIFKDSLTFIIISGVVFGAVHISDYGDIKQIILGIPYIIMGLDFAYIYHKTKNIYVTMSFHALHNLLLLILQFI